MEEETEHPGYLLDSQAAAYDAAAKKVLSFKVLLAWIMKYCTEEFREVSISDIAQKCIQGEPDVSGVAVDRDEIGQPPRISGESTVDASLSEGTVTYDIRFRALTPDQEPIAIILNIEMQKSSNLPYPLLKRVMYYLCRLVSAQKEVEFKGSDYGKIKKVYSIWLCMDTPHGESGITTYAMQELPSVGSVVQEKKNYDVMRAVMVYVGRKEVQQMNRLLRLLYLVFKAEQPAGVKLAELKKDFDITLTSDEGKELDEMCNLSAGIAERNYEYGRIIGNKEGREEGREEGRVEGREEGRVEGRREGRAEGHREERISMLLAMMSSFHVTAHEAMKAAHIPESEWAELEPYLKP